MAARFHKFSVYVTYFILLHSGLQIPAIHELVYNSIKQCGIDMRRNLFANIILSGGSTLFPGKVVAFNSLIHVCLYVRMYVCVCVCVLCACVHAYVCVFVSIYLCMYMYVCVWICNFDFFVPFWLASCKWWRKPEYPANCVCVCMYICMCVYVSIYLSLYVCMYIWMRERHGQIDICFSLKGN